MANAGPAPPGGVRETLGEEALRREAGEEDGEDGEEAPLPPGATLPADAFTSSEVKVKWKRRSLHESHSVRGPRGLMKMYAAGGRLCARA